MKYYSVKEGSHLAKLFLAPMAGITDRAFRQICKEFGADILVTEMISSRGIYYKDKKTKELLTFSDNERPIGIQLFGNEPEIMAYAVKVTEEYSPEFIDVNMGCPMPKIVNNGDGSALMKNPILAGKIVEAMVKATKIPITVKFRAGYTAETINAVDFAKVMEQSGASAITVHPRTREQLYTGKADHSITAAVKNAVKIPVVANGDIFSPEDAKKVLEVTNCDDIMIARGSHGNPFIFTQIKDYLTVGTYKEVSVTDKLSTALKQIELMCEFKPERQAIPEARKHMAWYMKGLYGGAKLKNKIFEANSKKDISDIIRSYLES